MNPYYVKVRRKNPITGNHVYMSLQLYQVDYKSHLLDFKVISSDHSEKTGGKKDGYYYSMWEIKTLIKITKECKNNNNLYFKIGGI